MSENNNMPKVTNKGSQEVKANIPQSAPVKGRVKTGEDLRSVGNANSSSNNSKNDD